MRKNGKREFSVVVERDEAGYYVASVPALPGCHTQARSLDKLMERIREAIELCLGVEKESAKAIEFLGGQKSANHAPGISRAAKRNKVSGFHPDIRRLTGLVPADSDAKAIYHGHLAARHP